MEALKAFRMVRLRECLALGCPLAEDSLVVVDEAGIPNYPDHYSDLFRAHTKEAGLPLIRLHDARHTAATLLHAGNGLPQPLQRSIWATPRWSTCPPTSTATALSVRSQMPSERCGRGARPSMKFIDAPRGVPEQ